MGVGKQREKGKGWEGVAFIRVGAGKKGNKPKIKRSCALRMQQLLF